LDSKKHNQTKKSLNNAIQTWVQYFRCINNQGGERMAERNKDRQKRNQEDNGKFAPLGELRPVDQPTDVLTATTVGDAGEVIAGDVGAKAKETTEREDLDT
jgi:hypothetical protein